MDQFAKPIALQLWTVRQDAREDFLGTLRQAAAVGFRGVEQVHAFGYGGLSAQQVRTYMTDLGLQTAGTHVSLQEWEGGAEKILDYQQELGVRYVAVSWLEPERREDEAAYRQSAASISKIARQCEARKLQLLYHHHDFEFVRFGSQTALELISEIVGPEQLGIEVDVHWVRRAGEDPVAFLRQMGARCPLVHFKDVPERALHTQDHDDPTTFTPLGTGLLDFPALAEAAAFAEYHIVEQDYCQGDPWDSARSSLAYLQQKGLAA